MNVFHTKRTIPVSSTVLFKAFEDPALLKKWWGPDGFTTTSLSFEFKPKGVWKFVMHGPGGQNFPNEMVFEEIVASKKVVMRHNVEPYFTLTVTFDEAENGTTLHWHQAFDNEDVARAMATIVKPANEQNLDKLQSLVANKK